MVEAKEMEVEELLRCNTELNEKNEELCNENQEVKSLNERVSIAKRRFYTPQASAVA